MGLWKMLTGQQPWPLTAWLNYKNQGQFGEYLINYALSNHNLRGETHVFTNLYVPYRGGTSEIDVLLLHEKGLFVFESKSYSGHISGTENSADWLETFRGGKKALFYNPILQNRTHICAVARFLGLDERELSSYIVFSGKCTLDKSLRTGTGYSILRLESLIPALRRELRRRDVRFTSPELRELAARLSTVCNASDQLKQQHIDDARRFAGAKDTPDGICPHCGARLVVRDGKYGRFYGCSAYPKCRFTSSLRDCRGRTVKPS